MHFSPPHFLLSSEPPHPRPPLKSSSPPLTTHEQQNLMEETQHSMEVSTKQFLPMPQQDPNSPSSSTSYSSSSSTSPSHPQHRSQPHNLPPSPRPVPRTIDTTPFPTTFVQADTSSFKQVVQMLTGAERQPAKTDAATTTTATAGTGSQAASGPCRPKKPSFKLYERRSSHKNLKMIAPLAMGPPPSPRRAGTKPEILSPSVLDFPSLKLSSPVTPLTGDPFNRSPASSSSEEAERAAIAERGFFLHPSPRGAEPPRLLPLFPVTSPRMAAPSE